MVGQKILTDITPEDAEAILSARPGGILVGGGALAFWLAGIEAALPTVLEAGVTTDIDFFGSKWDAGTFSRNMERKHGGRVDVFIPTAGDITPNSAKVVLYGYGQRAENEYVEIDYLVSIYGFSHEEQERMKKRAPLLTWNQIEFSVMHPIDVLKSRIYNLSGLPSKQNESGRAQAHAAIAVVRNWFVNDAHVGNPNLARSVHGDIFRTAEEVIGLATHRSGLAVFREFGIDVLAAVPVEHFSSDKFRGTRWPQVVAFTEEKRRTSCTPNTQTARRPRGP